MFASMERLIWSYDDVFKVKNHFMDICWKSCFFKNLLEYKHLLIKVKYAIPIFLG